MRDFTTSRTFPLRMGLYTLRICKTLVNNRGVSCSALGGLRYGRRVTIADFTIDASWL